MTIVEFSVLINMATPTWSCFSATKKTGNLSGICRLGSWNSLFNHSFKLQESLQMLRKKKSRNNKTTVERADKKHVSCFFFERCTNYWTKSELTVTSMRVPCK